MTAFEKVTEFVAAWGTLYFAAMFVVTLIYALRPSNQSMFDDAANVPLRED